MRFTLLARFVCLLTAAFGRAGAQPASSELDAIRAGLEASKHRDYAEARAILAPIVNSAEPGRRDLNLFTAMEVLATAEQNLGDLAAAAPLHEAVLQNTDESTPALRHLRILALNNLGELRGEQGRWGEAASLFRQGLDLDVRVSGPNSAAAAVSRNNLGALLIAQGNRDEGITLFEEALPPLRAAGDSFVPDLVGALTNLGVSYAASRRYGEALPLLREAVTLAAAQRPGETVYGDALAGLATAYRMQGDTARAEPLLRKAIAVFEHTGSLRGVRAASVWTNFGFVRLRDGKPLEAQQYFRRALDAITAAYGPDHPGTSLAATNLATAAAYNASHRPSRVRK